MQRITSIPGLTADDMKKLDSVFLEEERVDSVVLYGSRAKGHYRPGSDVDLTLDTCLLDTKQLAALEMKIDDLLLPYNMDISILNHIESEELMGHIDRVGIVIYEK